MTIGYITLSVTPDDSPQDADDDDLDSDKYRQNKPAPSVLANFPKLNLNQTGRTKRLLGQFWPVLFAVGIYGPAAGLQTKRVML